MAKVIIPATFRQRQFLDAFWWGEDCDEIVFGGARGGGKTWALCFGQVVRRLEYERTYGLMLRQLQKAADANLGTEIRKVCGQLGISVGRSGTIRWREGDKKFVFPNGSELVLGYCKKQDDWEQYQGLNYTDISLHELGQWTKEKVWDDISGSNRTDNPRCRPKMVSDLNPGGAGQPWIKKRFINERTRRSRSLFIQSLLRDNMAMLENDPGYRDRILGKLPEWRRLQWEDGSWDVVEGQYFDLDPRCVREVEVPYYADLYAGVDAGYWPAAYGVVYFAVWKEPGRRGPRIHVMRELKMHRLDAYQQASEALAIEGQLRFNPVARFADPMAWKVGEHASGMSAATAYQWAEKGFVVTPSTSRARIAGWLLLRTVMRHQLLTIDPSCHALVEEIEAAQHDDKTDDLISIPGQDDLLDAFRYGLLSTVAFDFPEEPDEDEYSSKGRKIAVARAINAQR